MNNTMKRTGLLAGVLVGGGCGLSPSLSTIDFGKVLVGQTSAIRNVSWNNGSDQPVDIIGWGVEPAPPFAMAQVPALATVQPAADSPTLGVTFAPQRKGAASGKGRPVAVPKPEKVRLRGEGVDSLLEGTGLGVDQMTVGDRIDFGSHSVHAAQPKTIQVVLTNDTGSPIALTGTVPTGGPVFGTASASVTIPARIPAAAGQPAVPGRATIILTFAPTSTGQHAGSVEFTGGSHRFAANLEGTGGDGETPGAGGDGDGGQ